jgi:hypothetical protein
MLYSKWRILSKDIETNEKIADKIVKAICILHNTIFDREGFERHLREIVDIPEAANFQHQSAGRPANTSKLIRDTFKSYICRNRLQFV